MVRKLVYWPADILKRVSEPLAEAPDPQLIADMLETMTAQHGAGLSAVQVGVLKRVLVVDSASLGPKVFVNPVLTGHSTEMAVRREGCLSVPGFFEDIHRWLEVTITYRDEHFELHENVEFHGFIAHVLQHELEHLDGKLYLDHLPRARRSQILGNMQALRRAGKLK